MADSAGYPAEGKASKDAKAPAPAAPAGPPPAEKTKEELAKLSKEDRTAYHAARRAAGLGPGAAGAAGGAQPAEGAANASAPAQLTKAERRALQDSQRKVKEDKANALKAGDEAFEELKLQGLTEDQAREVLAAIRSGEAAAVAEEEDDDDEAGDDLMGSVRIWMKEQEDGPIPEDAIRDFNMKVRFQGHVDSTPPDHLHAILTVLVEQGCKACDLAAPKIAPGAVAKVLGPILERWSHLLRGLYAKVPDVLEAIGAVVGSISQAVVASGAPEPGQDSAVVGCLMAIREVDDLVEDEDLLVGCKGVEPKSRVLEKFIEFLEDALEEDDEEEEDDE